MNKTRNTVILLFMSSILFVSCGSSRRTAVPLGEVPLVAKHTEKAETVRTDAKTHNDTLSLDEAIQLALTKNPQLKEFYTEIKSREARTWQESLLPNPALDIEVENFSGTGLYRGFKNTESTISIGQLVVLGGKIDKRTRIAAVESDIAMLQYEIQRLAVITRVREAFTQMLRAQRKMALERKLLELSQSFKTNVERLVQSGRLSRAESARAQVELSNREVALQQSLRQLNNARRRLAATWGAKTADFNHVKGDFIALKSSLDKDKLQHLAQNSPFVIRQKAVISRQKTQTQLATAQAIPDPVVRAGYRWLNESGDHAFVTSLSIPIPVFDRNQGGRQEAVLRERQSKERLRTLQNELIAETDTRLETIRNISNEIKIMKNTILPQALNAYKIIYENYLRGKYAIIDVLDAQRQLFNAEGRYIDLLAELNSQVITLEGLLGQSLDAL